jgi:hypothetical protein
MSCNLHIGYDLNYGNDINSHSATISLYPNYSPIFILSSWPLNCLFARVLYLNILYVIILTRLTVLFVFKITTKSLFLLLIHFSYYLFIFLTTYSLFTDLMPRFMASLVPIMETANSMLLQIFTAPPVPTPPQWVI